VLVSVLLGFAASRSKAWLAILIGLGVLFGYWGLCVVMAFGVFGSPALWPTACFSLTAVANLLGVFVARSDLAERLLRRREREIEILQDEDPESSERVDVRRVGRQIASTVHGESLKADWCIVRERLRGAEGEEIRAERYGACEHEAVVDVERQLSDQVFRDGQALLVPNVPRQFPKCSAALCPSAMAVPLTDGQEVIGSVVVGGKLREKFRGQPRYQVEDLQFMRALAREWSSRAVIAQYNRTLEDRVQKRTLDLQMANDRLRELDRQKSDFMNMVAHDLRTPLTSIRSYAEIMLTYKDEPPETYNEFLSVINDESVRLNSLIDNFLDLARIEAGSFRLEIVPTDLGKLIGHAVAVFRGHAEPKGIDLTAEVPPDLPKALCDGDRVAQVLANLLSNALKFTPEGGKVSIRAERFEAPESPGQPMVEVCVADTGPGIPKHAQEGIFEKFRQVETSDEKVKKIQRAGTGLGLPLCREFVEKHKGKIWVESDPGKGSRFHFTLFSEGSNMLEILQDRQANGQTALADGRQPG
jgi:signal transduction histidine kinase